MPQICAYYTCSRPDRNFICWSTKGKIPTTASQPTLALPPTPGTTITTLAGRWQATNAQGEPVDLPCPGDWAQTPGWETFAGRLSFSTTFVLNSTQAAQPLFLDLGQVGDIAEVLINGHSVGLCAWAPYHLRIDPHCTVGVNQLTVHVTNTIANYYEGLQRPSGLLGPVEILTTVVTRQSPVRRLNPVGTR